MTPEEQLIADAQLLVRRLERLSADSLWARRASGCRGALLKALDEAGVLDSAEPYSSVRPYGSVKPNDSVRPDSSIQSLDTERLRFLMQFGYVMLEKAAREIPYRP